MPCTDDQLSNLENCIFDFTDYQKESLSILGTDAIDSAAAMCGLTDEEREEGITETCWNSYWRDQESAFAATYADQLESVIKDCFCSDIYCNTGGFHDGYYYCHSGDADQTLKAYVYEELDPYDVDFNSYADENLVCCLETRWLVGGETCTDRRDLDRCPGCEDVFGWLPFDFYKTPSEACTWGGDFFMCTSATPEARCSDGWVPSNEAECIEEYGDTVTWSGTAADVDRIEGTDCVCADTGADWDSSSHLCHRDLVLDEETFTVGGGCTDDDGITGTYNSDGNCDVVEEEDTWGGADAADEEWEDVTCDAPSCCEGDGACDTDGAGLYDASNPEFGGWYCTGTGGSQGSCAWTEPAFATFDECVTYYAGAAAAPTDDELGTCFDYYPTECADYYCNNTVNANFTSTSTPGAGYVNGGDCDCFEAYRCINGLAACVDQIDGGPLIGGSDGAGGSHDTFYKCIMGSPCDFVSCAITNLGIDDGRWGYDISDAYNLMLDWEEELNDLCGDNDSFTYGPGKGFPAGTYDACNYLNLDVAGNFDCLYCAAAHSTLQVNDYTTYDANGDGIATESYGTCDCDSGYGLRSGYSAWSHEDACDPLYEEEYEVESGDAVWYSMTTPYETVDNSFLFSKLSPGWRLSAWDMSTSYSVTDLAGASEALDMLTGNVSLVYEYMGDAWGDEEDTTTIIRYYYPITPSGITSLTLESSDGGSTINYSNGPADSAGGEVVQLRATFGGDFSAEGYTTSPSLEQMTLIFDAAVQNAVPSTLTSGLANAQVFTFKKLAHAKLDESMFSVFDTKDIESAQAKIVSVSTTMTTATTSITSY